MVTRPTDRARALILPRSRAPPQPFFLTYICNSLFVINIPLWFAAKQRGYVRDVPNGVEWADIVAWFCGRDPEAQAESHAAPDRGGKLFSSGSPRSGSAGAGVGVITDTVPLLAPEDDEKLGHVASAARLDGVGEGASTGIRIRTKFEIFKASAAVCPLWFIANWTYNVSLSMTSVTSSTVISNTSSRLSITVPAQIALASTLPSSVFAPTSKVR